MMLACHHLPQEQSKLERLLRTSLFLNQTPTPQILDTVRRSLPIFSSQQLRALIQLMPLPSDEPDAGPFKLSLRDRALRQLKILQSHLMGRWSVVELHPNIWVRLLTPINTQPPSDEGIIVELLGRLHDYFGTDLELEFHSKSSEEEMTAVTLRGAVAKYPFVRRVAAKYMAWLLDLHIPSSTTPAWTRFLLLSTLLNKTHHSAYGMKLTTLTCLDTLSAFGERFSHSSARHGRILDYKIAPLHMLNAIDPVMRSASFVNDTMIKTSYRAICIFTREGSRRHGPGRPWPWYHRVILQNLIQMARRIMKGHTELSVESIIDIHTILADCFESQTEAVWETMLLENGIEILTLRPTSHLESLSVLYVESLRGVICSYVRGITAASLSRYPDCPRWIDDLHRPQNLAWITKTLTILEEHDLLPSLVRLCPTHPSWKLTILALMNLRSEDPSLVVQMERTRAERSMPVETYWPANLFRLDGSQIDANIKTSLEDITLSLESGQLPRRPTRARVKSSNHYHDILRRRTLSHADSYAISQSQDMFLDRTNTGGTSSELENPVDYIDLIPQ
ncbi:hypothetical protein C8J56DRAFT_940130 [Mycena floridula]|nr:hypothetical protein C8J56DRAFT_940130 [Mycena floridula]